MTNPLNSYSTTAVQPISNSSRSMLNLTGNGKLGYSGGVGMNYNGLLKSQQTSTAALNEVGSFLLIFNFIVNFTFFKIFNFSKFLKLIF